MSVWTLTVRQSVRKSVVSLQIVSDRSEAKEYAFEQVGGKLGRSQRRN